LRKVGVISQIIGPVLDVLFQSSPLVLNEMTVGKVTIEVQQLIDTGHPMTVPVGDFVLGRIFNVLGIPIDQSVGNDDIA